MKVLLLNILVFLGFSSAYAGTSEIIIKECKESSSEGGRGCSDGPVAGCSGCLKC